MQQTEHCTITWRSFEEEAPQDNSTILLKRKDLPLKHASRHKFHDRGIYSSDGELPVSHYRQLLTTHLWCYPDEDIKTEE